MHLHPTHTLRQALPMQANQEDLQQRWRFCKVVGTPKKGTEKQSRHPFDPEHLDERRG